MGLESSPRSVQLKKWEKAISSHSEGPNSFNLSSEAINNRVHTLNLVGGRQDDERAIRRDAQPRPL